MPEPASRLRAHLARLASLPFGEAFALVVSNDPLDLAGRVDRALAEGGRWLPRDAVIRRAARSVARDLAAAARAPNVEEWLTGHVERAVESSFDAESASEPQERDAWQRHHARIAAHFGIEDRDAADALHLFHQLPPDERRDFLVGLDLLRRRDARPWKPERWARFEQTFRGIMRGLQQGD